MSAGVVEVLAADSASIAVAVVAPNAKKRKQIARSKDRRTKKRAIVKSAVAVAAQATAAATNAEENKEHYKDMVKDLHDEKQQKIRRGVLNPVWADLNEQESTALAAMLENPGDDLHWLATALKEPFPEQPMSVHSLRLLANLVGYDFENELSCKLDVDTATKSPAWLTRLSAVLRAVASARAAASDSKEKDKAAQAERAKNLGRASARASAVKLQRSKM